MLLVAGSALLSVSGCIDGNDWDTDSSHARTFSPAASAIGLDFPDDPTTCKVTWRRVPDATSYILEVASDTLTDDTPLGSAAGSKVFGQDGSLTADSCLLTGLEQDAKYFLRVRATGPVGDSKWTYYEKRSFRTSFYQALKAVNNKDQSQAKLEWDMEKWKPTRLELYKGKDFATAEPVNLFYDDKDQSDMTGRQGWGNKTVKYLEASTTYWAVLYDGDLRIAKRDFSTLSPVAEGVIRVTLDGKTLTQDFIDGIKNEAGYDTGADQVVEINIPGGGEPVNMPAALRIPDKMCAHFIGLGEQPVLCGKEMDMSGNHASLLFDNICFEANYTDGDGNSQKGGYFVNLGAATNIADFKVQNCTFRNMGTTIFRTQKDEVMTLDNVTFEDCMIINCATGYSLWHYDGKNVKPGSLTVRNVTICECPGSKCIVYSKTADFAGKITLEQVTLNNVIASGQYLVDIGSFTAEGGIEITNCVFGKTDAGAKGSRFNEGCTWSVTNAYCLSDFAQTANTRLEDNWLAPNDEGCTLKEDGKNYDCKSGKFVSTKVFKKSAPDRDEKGNITAYNCDFSINPGMNVPTSGVGDQRWWK